MADDRGPANDDQSPLSSGDPLGTPAGSDAPVDKSPTLPGPFAGGSAAPFGEAMQDTSSPIEPPPTTPSGWSPEAGTPAPSGLPTYGAAPAPPEPAAAPSAGMASGDPLGVAPMSAPPVSPTESVAPPGFAPPAAPPAPAPASYGGGPVPPGAFPSAPMPAPGPAPMGQYQLAGWGKRAGAVIIDSIIVTVIMVVLLVIVGALFGGVGSLLGDGGGGLLAILAVSLAIFPIFVVAALSQPYMMAKSNGQTLGKKMLGIRVVRTSGQATDFGWSALRQIGVIGLLFGVVGGSFFIPWLLNYLWPLWDEENRALHDMLVSSRVVEAS